MCWTQEIKASSSARGVVGRSGYTMPSCAWNGVILLGHQHGAVPVGGQRLSRLFLRDPARTAAPCCPVSAAGMEQQSRMAGWNPRRLALLASSQFVGSEGEAASFGCKFQILEPQCEGVNDWSCVCMDDEFLALRRTWKLGEGSYVCNLLFSWGIPFSSSKCAWTPAGWMPF